MNARLPKNSQWMGWRGTMVSKDFRRQLEGYGLTTANITLRKTDKDDKETCGEVVRTYA